MDKKTKFILGAVVAVVVLVIGFLLYSMREQMLESKQMLELVEMDKREMENERSVMEDLFEAIIGAVAIDTSWNMDILVPMVERLLDLEQLLENGFEGEPDYEGDLRKWFERKKMPFEPNIERSTQNEELYICTVKLGEYMLNYKAFGVGKTEKGRCEGRLLMLANT